MSRSPWFAPDRIAPSGRPWPASCPLSGVALAEGVVASGLAAVGTDVEIKINGEFYPVYDANGSKTRG